jgi:LacI family transcriptional regulator
MMSDATIYDVAERARVSISTVSRVLNSPDAVQPATRSRVFVAIDELGFVPKAEAVARARKNLGRIGILTPYFTFFSFVDRLQGLSMASVDLPYELVIYYVDSAARRDGYLLSLPVTRRLDGLIIIALQFDDAVAHRLLTHGLATVLLEAPHPSFSGVEINDDTGGQMAAEYLLAQRRRRCAFVGDSDVPDYAIHTSDWRLAGYRRALHVAGIGLPDAYIARAPHGMEQARAQAHRLLSLPEPPDAIFAASDIQAMGVLKAARERGIAVPKDLAVIGFDDIEMADYIGLTTIRQSLKESGRIALELLLTQLSDRSRPIQHVRLPLEIVRRETA